MTLQTAGNGTKTREESRIIGNNCHLLSASSALQKTQKITALLGEKLATSWR